MHAVQLNETKLLLFLCGKDEIDIQQSILVPNLTLVKPWTTVSILPIIAYQSNTGEAIGMKENRSQWRIHSN